MRSAFNPHVFGSHLELGTYVLQPLTTIDNLSSIFLPLLSSSPCPYHQIHPDHPNLATRHLVPTTLSIAFAHATIFVNLAAVLVRENSPDTFGFE